MKTFRLIGMALLVIFICTSFSACSSDDEEVTEPTNSEKIVGKWKKIVDDGSFHTHITFTNNGTFSMTCSDRPDYEEHGKYKIEKDLFYQLFSDEETWCLSKIELLNSERLTLQDLEDDGITPDGKPYSYQRVN